MHAHIPAYPTLPVRIGLYIPSHTLHPPLRPWPCRQYPHSARLLQPVEGLSLWDPHGVTRLPSPAASVLLNKGVSYTVTLIVAPAFIGVMRGVVLLDFGSCQVRCDAVGGGPRLMGNRAIGGAAYNIIQRVAVVCSCVPVHGCGHVHERGGWRKYIC